MKKLLALALCLSLALTLFGCAAENKPFVPSGGALVMDDPGSTQVTVPVQEEESQELTMTFYAGRSMNPFTAADYTNRALFSLIYQGLFAVSRDYEAYPVLCGRYQVSEDMKTYTFYVDENARFSDGTSVTAQDVLASYSAAMGSAFYKGRFTHIHNIGLDGSGVVFTLSTPMENLPILLDIPIIKATQVGANTPLGSGPYTFHTSITGGYLQKVTDWWCGKTTALAVNVDSIPLIPAESPAQIRDEFEFYDLDLVCANPCSDLYADYRCDYELWDCENGEMIYLACNVAHRDIFAGKALRSALTYAIDRETLIGKYYQGFARSVTLPASTHFPYYSAGLASRYEYDPVRFKEALAGVYLPTRSLVLLVNSDDTLRLQAARDIAAALTELGLPTITNEQDTENYLAHIYAANYDMYLGSTRLSANMDLSAFFKSGGSLSYNGIANEDIYDLCLDALENHGNYQNLYQKIADDGRIVPLIFCGYAVYATRGLLSDLEPARDNVFFYTVGKTMEDALVAVDYSS